MQEKKENTPIKIITLKHTNSDRHEIHSYKHVDHSYIQTTVST